MFSSSSLKPSPTSLGSSIVGHYIGGWNEELRQRGELEEAIRVASAITPLTTGLNVGSEILELHYHIDKETKILRNENIKKSFEKIDTEQTLKDETFNELKNVMYDVIFDISTDNSL